MRRRFDHRGRRGAIAALVGERRRIVAVGDGSRLRVRISSSVAAAANPGRPRTVMVPRSRSSAGGPRPVVRHLRCRCLHAHACIAAARSSSPRVHAENGAVVRPFTQSCRRLRELLQHNFRASIEVFSSNAAASPAVTPTEHLSRGRAPLLDRPVFERSFDTRRREFQAISPPDPAGDIVLIRTSSPVAVLHQLRRIPISSTVG